MEVDWNSIEQLKTLRSKIDRRLNQLIVVEKKYKKSHVEVYDSCMKIYLTDISSLYEDRNDLNEQKNFYVYAHCDPFFGLKADTNGKIAFASMLGLTHLPFYIGKGTGTRAYDLNRSESHRKKRQFIENSNKEVMVSILQDNLTEKEALMIESKLIDIFGLTSFGGWLVNLDEGSNNHQRKQIYFDDYINVNKMLKMKNSTNLNTTHTGGHYDYKKPI
jgi:hypothetical protein